MKTSLFVLRLIAAGSALFVARTGWTATPALSLGGRYHCDHSVYTDLPFGSGDISYDLMLEYRETIAAWQLGINVAPDISGTREADDAALPEDGTKPPGTDYVITPNLSLVFSDRMIVGGTGIRISYIRDAEGEGEWTSLYWQLQLGLDIPLGKSLGLGAGVYYVLERWDKITDFKLEDLEYGADLKYRF